MLQQGYQEMLSVILYCLSIYLLFFVMLIIIYKLDKLGHDDNFLLYLDCTITGYSEFK